MKMVMEMEMILDHKEGKRRSNANNCISKKWGERERENDRRRKTVA